MQFKVFDRDGNGSVPASELEEALKSMGAPVTKELVDGMMKEADFDSKKFKGKCNIVRMGLC